MSSMSPPITSKNCPPIFVDHDKSFFRYVFNLCMTKANLTSMTSLRMQHYSLIEILKGHSHERATFSDGKNNFPTLSY